MSNPLGLTCDMLYIRDDDSAQIATGTPTTDGTKPGYPVTPADCCYPLAMVFLDSSMSAISELYIEDTASTWRQFAGGGGRRCGRGP